MTSPIEREEVINRSDRKDQTTDRVLETLARLEGKMNCLGINGGTNTVSRPGGSVYAMAASHAMPSRAPPTISADIPGKIHSKEPLSIDTLARSTVLSEALTIPHRVVAWPSVYAHLATSEIAAAADLPNIVRQRTPWFLKQELVKHPCSLTSDVGLASVPIDSPTVEHRWSPNVTFPFLGIQQVMEYSDTYFNTFNMLDPILDQEHFVHTTIARLLQEEYAKNDSSGVLALLVFALAEVATAGTYGQPLSESDTHTSGFRGGTLHEPPGLAMFNEARSRLSFVTSQGSLENVQIMLLQATYYEACSRHLDYWSSTVAASMACQVLLKCEDINWTSAHGDLVKRAYWSCVLKEDLYHLDLDLPRTGIRDLENRVPLPHFGTDHERQASDPRSLQDTGSIEEREKAYASFLAMISLQRIISRVETVIEEGKCTAPKTLRRHCCVTAKGLHGF